MSHDEMIAVIAAHRDGKEIERRATDAGIKFQEYQQEHPITGSEAMVSGPGMSISEMKEWNRFTWNQFNFSLWEYRIKHEPLMPREWWITLDDDGQKVVAGMPYKPGFPLNLIRVREVLPSPG